MPSSKKKYTDPELRDEVKEEVQAGDKGGAPGQWSARKAQLMASEYKKRGGGYKGEKDETQKHLDKWTEEDWQTKEGSGDAKQADGTEKRYLPKEAWEQMSEKEKEETEAKKLEGSRKGKQYVGNTTKANDARNAAQRKNEERRDNQSDEEDAVDGEGAQLKNGSKARDGAGEKQGNTKSKSTKEAENSGTTERNDKQSDAKQTEKDKNKDAKSRQAQANGSRTNRQKASDAEKASKETDASAQTTTRKRTRSSTKEDRESASKKQKGNKDEGSTEKKTVGSRHDPAEPPAPHGSKDRLPKKGQQVHWKALPGYVDGEVVEILTKEKDVEGKKVKGSKSDPRIVLKSNSSGKICVHKPEAVFFD